MTQKRTNERHPPEKSVVDAAALSEETTRQDSADEYVRTRSHELQLPDLMGQYIGITRDRSLWHSIGALHYRRQVQQGGKSSTEYGIKCEYLTALGRE